MGWDFYSLEPGRNQNLIYKVKGKLIKGFYNPQTGLFKLNVDTLTIYPTETQGRRVIPIKPLPGEYDKKRLVALAQKYFGKDNIVQIWKRGGFRVIGKKLIWSGRKRLHAKEKIKVTGLVEKIWERNKPMAPQPFNRIHYS